MAGEEYWIKQQKKLFDREFGALADLPIDVRDHLQGFTFSFSNRNVVKLRVLGFETEANTLLSNYYQPLKETLADEDICAQIRNENPRVKSSMLPMLLGALSVAHWLSTGQIDLELAKRTLIEIENDDDYASNSGPSFNAAMLTSIEANERAKAEARYSRLEKKPLTELPTNFRFSGNPRHVLMAHLKYGNDPSTQDFLETGLEKFSTRAKQWEKSDAIPFIDILDLARIVFQCRRLINKPVSFEELWAIIR